MKTAESDRLILANGKELLHYTDSTDLQCRDSEVIDDLYHPDWFFEYADEEYFEPPAVYLTEGVIKFINGRHRSILLSRHIDEFPVLIGNVDMDAHWGTASQESIDVLNKITISQFTEHSIFNGLPELSFGGFKKA